MLSLEKVPPHVAECGRMNPQELAFYTCNMAMVSLVLAMNGNQLAPVVPQGFLKGLFSASPYRDGLSSVQSKGHWPP